MLMRFDPFSELDRFGERFVDGRRTRFIPMDAYRAGDEFRVYFDVPGVDPDTIELTVEKNVLTIRAERHWDSEGVETIVCERPQGSFSRQLLLGDGLDLDKLAARYHNGVLGLRIPVAESAKPKRVEITTADKAAAITPSAA